MADMWRDNSAGYMYPVTKMNFLVTILNKAGALSFTEVTGVEASVEVIEYRQGNATLLSPVKIPGLVKHGNITLKFGTVLDASANEVYKWMQDCVSDLRTNFKRCNVIIELVESNDSLGTSVNPYESANKSIKWILNDAWVTRLNIPDMDAKGNDVAIGSCEIAYETITFPTATA